MPVTIGQGNAVTIGSPDAGSSHYSVITRHAAPHYAEHRPPQLLTISEVAALLRLHHRTVRLRIRDGSIPAIRVGGSIRVPAPALEQWLAEREQEALDAVRGGDAA